MKATKSLISILLIILSLLTGAAKADTSCGKGSSKRDCVSQPQKPETPYRGGSRR